MINPLSSYIQASKEEVKLKELVDEARVRINSEIYELNQLPEDQVSPEEKITLLRLENSLQRVRKVEDLFKLVDAMGGALARAKSNYRNIMELPEGERGRQLRKNITTNVIRDGQYTIDGKTMSGAEVQKLHDESIAGNIKQDTERIEKELGITKVNRIKNKESVEHKEAKLAHLKALRSRIEKEVAERDLPQNYLDGLDIIPNGPFDYKFRVPLSFPNFSARFETIVAGIFNKEIYKQKLKGQEAVQIAELGGHSVSGELRMYDGQNGGAEVRIKASTLGFTAEEIEGKTAADFAGDPRLEFIG